MNFTVAPHSEVMNAMLMERTATDLDLVVPQPTVPVSERVDDNVSGPSMVCCYLCDHTHTNRGYLCTPCLHVYGGKVPQPELEELVFVECPGCRSQLWTFHNQHLCPLCHQALWTEVFAWSFDQVRVSFSFQM